MIDTLPGLTGWIPFRIRTADGQPVVDWCHLGEERFTAPFFRDTIERCLRKPFNQLFLQETTIDALVDGQAGHPAVLPTAFIFHGSRCGSTLMTQMAAALPDTIVIAEAEPIDDVLEAHAPDEVRIGWLRGLMSAFGRTGRARERSLVVKFDAWHTRHIALVQRAFPGVPCVFLYRDPAAVIASHLRMPGSQMVPGMRDPDLIGLDLAGALRLDREEYSSRMLGSIYRAAESAAAAGRVTLMNYSEWPERAAAQVLEWCRPADRDDACARLREVAQFDAKTPSLPYDGSAAAHVAPSARVVETVARFVAPHYAQLEATRLARPAS